MKYYYIANSIYQFAYALPLYRRIGGVFVVNSRKKWWQFKRKMKGLAHAGEKNFNNTPDVIILPRTEVHRLEGVLIFLANTIVPGQKYTRAITLFHEHGTSDKMYEGDKEAARAKLGQYDYILLSGPKNHHRLMEIGLDPQSSALIPVGALRFDDWSAGRYRREDALRALGVRDTRRKNILYAPTWRFGDGTFRQLAWTLIKTLTKEYNLILRPHYHDRRFGLLLYWWARTLGYRHLYYSDPEDIQRQDTYVAFAASDLLLTDMSSVMYEYLITQKPVILAQNHFAHRHHMPVAMDMTAHVDMLQEGMDIGELVSRNLASASKEANRYRSLLDACFYLPTTGAVACATAFIQKLKKS
jgi:CDP-glycerol glycerophosphotransferase (TagB/SpsB family)